MIKKSGPVLYVVQLSRINELNNQKKMVVKSPIVRNIAGVRRGVGQKSILGLLRKVG